MLFTKGLQPVKIIFHCFLQSVKRYFQLVFVADNTTITTKRSVRFRTTFHLLTYGKKRWESFTHCWKRPLRLLLSQLHLFPPKLTSHRSNFALQSKVGPGNPSHPFSSLGQSLVKQNENPIKHRHPLLYCVRTPSSCSLVTSVHLWRQSQRLV